MTKRQLVKQLTSIAGRLETDYLKLENPLSEADLERTKQAIAKREPQLKKLCEQYLELKEE